MLPKRRCSLKVEVEYLEYMWPMRHYLVTCGDMQKRSNIISLSFCMPVSREPPEIAIAVGKNAYSRGLIDDSREFVINVPRKELKREIYYCGFHSGRDVNKFTETELTAKPAKKVKAPIIDECVAHMECAVRNQIETGDKVLIIGEVVEAYADTQLAGGGRSAGFGYFAAGEFPRKIYAGRNLRNRGADLDE